MIKAYIGWDVPCYNHLPLLREQLLWGTWARDDKNG